MPVVTQCVRRVDTRFYMLREQARGWRPEVLGLKVEGLMPASQNPRLVPGERYWCDEPEDRRIERAMDAGPVRSVGESVSCQV